MNKNLFSARIAMRVLAGPLNNLPSATNSPALPWQREIPLREAAQSVMLQNMLNYTDPLPGPSMSIKTWIFLN